MPIGHLLPFYERDKGAVFCKDWSTLPDLADTSMQMDEKVPCPWQNAADPATL